MFFKVLSYKLYYVAITFLENWIKIVKLLEIGF